MKNASKAIRAFLILTLLSGSAILLQVHITAAQSSPEIGTVTSTLLFWNDTVVPGNYNGGHSGGYLLPPITYDPQSDELYVLDAYGNVTTLAASNLKITSSNEIGNFVDAQYDPGTNYVYLAGYAIFVDNGGQLAGVISTPASVGITALAYDPTNHYFYDAHDNNITIINGVTSSLVADVPISPVISPNAWQTPLNISENPYDAIAYDAANGDVYIAEQFIHGIQPIYVFSTTTNQVVANFTLHGPTGSVFSAAGITYDPQNNGIYIGGPAVYSNRTAASYVIYAIKGSDNSISANITMPINSPKQVARVLGGLDYVSANNYIYVSGVSINSISVIDPSTNTVLGSIPVGRDPEQMAFDPNNNNLYVTSVSEDTISVISVGSSGQSTSSSPSSVSTTLASHSAQTVSSISSSSKIQSTSTTSMVTTPIVTTSSFSTATSQSSSSSYSAQVAFGIALIDAMIVVIAGLSLLRRRNIRM